MRFCFLLALVTIYFLIAFVIYGVSDYMSRLAALAPAKEREISSLKYKVAAEENGVSVAFVKRELDRLSTQDFETQCSRAAEIMFGPDDRFAASATIRTRAISWPRIFFEFFLPILVGGYAIYTLLTGSAS